MGKSEAKLNFAEVKVKGTKKVDPQSAQDALKKFDLRMKYGPHAGITRTSRWQRAKELHLNPPKNVLDILQNKALQKADPKLNVACWDEYLE